MNPKLYCRKTETSTREFILHMRKRFPKYSKAVHSMASNPDKYGVELTQAATRHVCPQAEHRQLSHRLYLRCSDAFLEGLTKLKSQMGVDTMQEFLLSALEEWIAIKEAVSADTETTSSESALERMLSLERQAVND